MDAPESFSINVLDALPPAVQAWILWQMQQIERLTTRVVKLEAKLDQAVKNSTNTTYCSQVSLVL